MHNLQIAEHTLIKALDLSWSEFRLKQHLFFDSMKWNCQFYSKYKCFRCCKIWQWSNYMNILETEDEKKKLTYFFMKLIVLQLNKLINVLHICVCATPASQGSDVSFLTLYVTFSVGLQWFLLESTTEESHWKLRNQLSSAFPNLLTCVILLYKGSLINLKDKHHLQEC